MQLSIESWIWYSFAVATVVARLVSRTLLFGTPLALQPDDWIMGAFTLPTYTVLLISSNIVRTSQTNLLAPTFNTSTLTPTDLVQRTHGSKLVIVTEQMQIAVIWSCKICLLILYHRLTRMVSPKSNIAIKILALYVVLGFVVMEILYFGVWCRPFNQYWAIPTYSRQCNALTSHRITNAVFNISSDLIMLCIALPIFLASLLPLKRKLILCAVFSLGIFVILAAVLNKYYSFHQPWSLLWTKWYMREASLAVLVANVPFTWTLLRKLFNLGAFDESRPPPATYHSARSGGGRRTARAHAGGGGTGGSGSGERRARPSVEKYGSHGSASASGGMSGSGSGKDRRSLSLIGSMCTPKEERASHNNASIMQTEDSENSRNGLMEQTTIQTQDFAIAPAIIRSRYNDPIDLEERDTGIEQATTPSPHSYTPVHSPLRPKRTSHLSADGTGGFNLSTPRPRSALLTPTQSLSPEPSTSSMKRRTLSPAPSASSRGTKDGGAKSTVASGGGRSARDRKMRARVSS